MSHWTWPRAKTRRWVWTRPKWRVCRRRRSSPMPCRRNVWPSGRPCATQDRSRACRPNWTWPAGCDWPRRRICSAMRLADSRLGCLCRSSSSRRVLGERRNSLAWPLDSNWRARVWASPIWKRVSKNLFINLINNKTIINSI